MERTMSRQTLVSALWNRGFEIERPLQSTLHSSVFCVREIPGSFTTTKAWGSGPYVAKAVSMGGLDAQGRAAALQEVSMLRGIASHPNLIQYRDSFLEEAAGLLLMVMSFAECGDLRGAVANAHTLQRPLPAPAVLWWLRQMLAGLAHLHSQSVVHRDLKSSNIFLADGMRQIRIGDFGISKVLESTDFASSVVGTPAYMSPELMRNERYDYHVDMWALGCVCFELCTLRLPFIAKSLLDLVQQVVGTEPEWSQWDRCYSQEVRSVARRCLRKDATGRPTAEEALAEPLFQEGRGALPPGENVWNFAPAEKHTVNLKESGDEATRLSDASTADTAEDGLRQSGGDTWTLTPRMPWETSSRSGDSNATRSNTSPSEARLTQTAPSCFGWTLSQVRDPQSQLPKADFLMQKTDFQDLLSSQHEQLQLDITPPCSANFRNGGYHHGDRTPAPVYQVPKWRPGPSVEAPKRSEVGEDLL